MHISRSTRRAGVIALAASALVAAPAAALTLVDFGKERESALGAQADDLFGGIGEPLAAAAATVPFAAGDESVELASGLQVSDVLSGDTAGGPEGKLYQNADMIAFYPTDSRPQWAIVCIENNTTNPGVQRIRLRGRNRGQVETILSGTRSCDGIRRTPWNTIIATEEREDGWALEIYDPLETTGVAFNRATGELSGEDAANVKTRPALGRFAWEGLHVFEDGTVIAGDELGPKNRTNGGALFKFVSDRKPSGPASTGFLSNPANHASSPFAEGKLYALEIGDADNRGQGNQRGKGRWIGPVNPAMGRAEGQAKGTGFYRPEDLQADPVALAKGEVRVCWTNTGNVDIGNYGEVLCLDDRQDAAAVNTGMTPEVQRFLEGNPYMNQPDNLAFQPGTGIVYVIEDSPTVNGEDKPGDIWACLRDGADRDLQSDGCSMVASVKTQGAEPTGFIFDASGRNAYLNIQHSPDDPSTPDIDESTFDEMLVIDGFRPGRATATR
ncbi:MAG: alkaline phosphatase PhoX [Solirubrobacteraceae bacterium]